MEETVTIKLETYNHLRDFKEEILGGGVVEISSKGIYYYNADTVAAKLAQDIDYLTEENATKKEKIKNLEADLRVAQFKVREMESKFAAMTANEYIDWKKQYNLENL